MEIVPPAGSGLDQLLVGRGAAYGDYDGDGDLDILVSQNQGPALLLRNDTPRQAHYLRVHLRGQRATMTALAPKCACIEAIRCSGKWCAPAGVTTAERAALDLWLRAGQARGPRGDCLALRQRRCLPGRAWGYDLHAVEGAIQNRCPALRRRLPLPQPRPQSCHRPQPAKRIWPTRRLALRPIVLSAMRKPRRPLKRRGLAAL